MFKNFLYTNIMKNEHMIIQISGGKWHFYYNKENGICYNKQINGNWSSYKVLFDKGQEDFDIAVDENDNIHLVCQDDTGNIIYFIYHEKIWKKFVVLKSKQSTSYKKYFKIIIIDKWINLLYVIEHNNRSLLTHQILDNGTQPYVIDYVAKTDIPFYPCKNNLNDIQVYYKNDSGNIGSKTFVWSQKNWNNFIAIDDIEPNSEISSVIIDKNNTTHLIYVNNEDKNYSIIYKRKIANDFSKSSWDKKVTVFKSISKKFPVIFKENDSLWTLWQQNNKVIGCSSIDNGNSWNKPTQFMASGYGYISLLSYKNPVSTLYYNVICDKCYAYITNNNIKPYIISKYNDKEAPEKPKPQFKPVGHDIEQFAKSNNNFNNSTDKIPSNSFPNDTEITKLKITANMFKEQLIKTQKKIIEISQALKNMEKTIQEKYDTSIEDIKAQNTTISEKINELKEDEKSIINSELDNIKKEIELLKRDTNKVSFTDLMKNKKAEDKKLNL